MPDVLLWTADAEWGAAAAAAHEAAGLSASVIGGTDLQQGEGGSSEPQVVVFDLVSPASGPGVVPIELIERLLPLHPELTAVLVVEEESVDLYRRALRAGAYGLAVRSQPPEQLVEQVRAAMAQGARRAGAPVQSRKPAIAWAVFGSKGGTGKTTLAVNLAVALAGRKRRTALLDLNFGFGSAHVFLDLTPRREVSELLSDIRRLDRELLEEYTLRHTSGLRVLPAPVRPEVADFVTAQHVERLLEVAEEQFEHIVMDLPPTFSEFAVPAQRRADVLLLVTAADLAGLAAVRTALSGLSASQVDPQRIRLVVRASERGHGLTDKDVEAAVGLKIWAKVPWDDAATTRALNHGVPVVTSHVHSRYAGGIGRLMAALDKESG